MSNGLIDLEDAMYLLYLRFYPSDQAVKTGFDALHIHTNRLIRRFPEATADILVSSAYRLHRRVFSNPYTIETHTPRNILRLRPAQTHVHTFSSQQDLALAIQTAITSKANHQTINQIASLTFETVNQPSLNNDLEALRAQTNCVALCVHQHTRFHIPTPLQNGFMDLFHKH
ncbi:hypothetical protein AU074_13725 [Pseudomonas sp. ATCC PTA-122608]|uniref:hypothetical protein n=1 Tax=Pseudomonas sp. ATCC PTA-122608 TaxID=1771311 RepID=UPI00096BC451|nr:hypothetical protein [Pseudomonas sp. ATCC PTA-122608]OLY72229.1 hypothetical protein AU074_13725 [Pseudomonas sp. ATCC PTA-122608]